jgi:hypothetical protein
LRVAGRGVRRKFPVLAIIFGDFFPSNTTHANHGFGGVMMSDTATS